MCIRKTIVIINKPARKKERQSRTKCGRDLPSSVAQRLLAFHQRKIQMNIINYFLIKKMKFVLLRNWLDHGHV